ncbi:MAG: hypothetical protein QGG48_08250 [Desulfatiglandales bacterium]|nr:hypothetical protein [Desulfatiglandales bacterium]
MLQDTKSPYPYPYLYPYPYPHPYYSLGIGIEIGIGTRIPQSPQRGKEKNDFGKECND